MSIPHIYDIASYWYDLPQERIAQYPVKLRDQSRLMVCKTVDGTVHDRMFCDLLDYLDPGDLLVVNDTKVFPARLLGRKESGGRVELLLLHYPDCSGQSAHFGGRLMARAEVVGLLRASKRCRAGQKIFFADDLAAEVLELYPEGKARVALFFDGELSGLFEREGNLPLPPYIRREHGEQREDRERYQTVFASRTGAIAAPTAGLHFSDELLAAIAAKGVGKTSVTLHVGYGTFAPVRVTDIREHVIHSEYVTVSEETAEQINAVKKAGKRIWAVGTTTARSLEFCCDAAGRAQPMEGWCNLYIYPGYRFRLVENLITNFHLPGSSLLFMVSALVGRERLLSWYAHALANDYRFFSYGDAMLICAAGPS